MADTLPAALVVRSRARSCPGRELVMLTLRERAALGAIQGFTVAFRLIVHLREKCVSAVSPSIILLYTYSVMFSRA